MWCRSVLAPTALLLGTCWISQCRAFSVPSFVETRLARRQHPARDVKKLELSLDANNKDPSSSTKNIPVDAVTSRRQLMQLVLSSGTALMAGSSFLTARPSIASAAADNGGATVYISGKTPQVPGQKPKDKNDVSGTRKDPNFLRSIADCKNQCENRSNPSDGSIKTKEECLSECQDICCTTYEQCTFAIVPRI